MDSRLRELSEHIDRHRASLRAAVDTVPAELRETPPADGGWSVAGVLEHVAIVEGRVAAALEKQIADARASGVGPETDETPILSAPRIAMFTDRTRKIRAPEHVQPKQVHGLDEIWRQLDAAHASMHALLASAEGLKLSDLTMPHPIFGPLDLYTWFAFVGSHDERHAAQIREIGASFAQSS